MSQVSRPDRAVRRYGHLDTSFQAAGGVEGIEKLVRDFYHFMDTLPEARRIRAMHPESLVCPADRLARFLCGWLGGPKLYAQKYGSINIPGAHQHLHIGDEERDAWLLCMRKAIEQQHYEPEFAEYLMRQLRVPAERIRQVSQLRRQQCSEALHREASR